MLALETLNKSIFIHICIELFTINIGPKLFVNLKLLFFLIFLSLKFYTVSLETFGTHLTPV